MKDTNAKISLEISKELKEKLEKLADEKEMSVSGLIRFILKNYLKED